MIYMDLKILLEQIAAEEFERFVLDPKGGAAFMGKPERWWKIPHWRCRKGHVSLWFVSTDREGVCPACGQLVLLTFPEDVDGPYPLVPK